MLQTILHRGPDEVGHFNNDTVALAHARLSIIDLNTGTQPMSYANGRYVIVYNGEIYNHRSVREMLEGRGHKFRTSSDTEVILAAYVEWGRACLDRLRGMFAFALWDTADRSLWLVRDRLGIKPLYYAVNGREITFGSETKAVVASLPTRPSVDAVALHQVMNYRFVRGTRTMWEGIHRLPPGHTLRWHDGDIQIERYWQAPAASESADLETAELADLLEGAVTEHLVSDVPVASFVSGGLDSTAVAAWAKPHLQFPMQTYCLNFGTRHDETHHARAASAEMELDFRAIEMRPADFRHLEKVMWHLDEPVGDAIAIATYVLAEQASTGTKVVLTGEGADEIFGGYIHYRALRSVDVLGKARLAGLTSRLAGVVPMIPQQFLGKVFPYPGTIGAAGKDRIQQLVTAIGTPGAPYRNLTQVFGREGWSRLYSPAFAATVNDVEAQEDERARQTEARDGSALAAAIRMDLEEWLPNYTLHRLDRLLMAHGLEGRVPFLDHRVVEAALRLPAASLLSPFQEKKALRKAAPERIRRWADRPKQAFSVPLDEPAFAEAAGSQIKELIASAIDSRRGSLSTGELERYLHFGTGDLLSSKQVMAIATTEAWHRVFVDQPHASLA
jgi:asparagine synthase (glutamine-hydrolysing)